MIDEDYQVERIVNYNVEHITELDLKFIDQLKKNMPNIIYVYSQNSAKSLLKIIKKYELIDYWMNTNLMCLGCLLYTSPSPRDKRLSRMPSSA